MGNGVPTVYEVDSGTPHALPTLAPTHTHTLLLSHPTPPQLSHCPTPAASACLSLFGSRSLAFPAHWGHNQTVIGAGNDFAN